MKFIFVAQPNEGPWAKLLRRSIRATLLSTFSFYVLTYPFPREMSVPIGFVLARVLDFPISLLNAVLPWQLQSGFAAQFSSGTYCFPGSLAYERFRYLSVGIPAWTGLLYLPDAVRAAWPRVCRRLWHDA